LGRGRSAPRLVHQRAHAGDARLEAGEDRLADQEMADIQFGELRDRRHRGDIVEGQAVAGMGLDAVPARERGGVGEAAQFGRPLLSPEMRVAAGVEFDDRRAQPDRGRDLGRVGLDEQADADAGLAQFIDIISQVVVLAGGVEPAFGGPLLALLGNQARGVGTVAQRDFEHLLGRRHFEVERDFEPRHERVDIGVGDVAPILAQMGGDAVGAGRRRGQRGADRIGMQASPRVPDRRDMVDIDAEAQMARHAAFRLPGFSAGMAASASGRFAAS
jgi:hypothetical protein